MVVGVLLCAESVFGFWCLNVGVGVCVGVCERVWVRVWGVRVVCLWMYVGVCGSVCACVGDGVCELCVGVCGVCV
jgi:hypothetical protein